MLLYERKFEFELSDQTVENVRGPVWSYELRKVPIKTKVMQRRFN